MLAGKSSSSIWTLSFLMMINMMNCFCGIKNGMVDRQKAFSLIFSPDHCQRSSQLRISDTPRAGFESAQNLSSGLVGWSCAVVITTTPRRFINVLLTPGNESSDFLLKMSSLVSGSYFFDILSEDKNYVTRYWVKIFKNGPRKIFGTQPFKGCLLQTLLGLFLNTLAHEWRKMTFFSSYMKSVSLEIFLEKQAE